MPDKVLIVDDDKQLLEELGEELTNVGFSVDTAEDGKAALSRFESFQPDVLVLDITLPTLRHEMDAPKDGLEVLSRIRQKHTIPVIMLSNTTIGTVKVMALDMGADDYITKPFDAKELVARIHAVLRRTREATDELPILECGPLRIDAGARKVFHGEEEIILTAIEFDLLHTLASRPGQVFTREQLLERHWPEQVVTSKVVDVHIGKLRKKIKDDPHSNPLIHTVRSVGYRLDPA